MSFYFSLDGYNTDGSDVSSTLDLDFPYDISALRDSPIPFLCITDDNDVTHSPDSPGTPIHFLVRYTLLWFMSFVWPIMCCSLPDWSKTLSLRRNTTSAALLYFHRRSDFLALKPEKNWDEIIPTFLIGKDMGYTSSSLLLMLLCWRCCFCLNFVNLPVCIPERSQSEPLELHTKTWSVRRGQFFLTALFSFRF